MTYYFISVLPIHTILLLLKLYFSYILPPDLGSTAAGRRYTKTVKGTNYTSVYRDVLLSSISYYL